MMRRLLVFGCASGIAAAAETDIASQRLVGAALLDGAAYATVASLTDQVGSRLAGTPGAERAVVWALSAMKQAGLTHVHTEPVRVERWVRGEAEAALVAPFAHPLHVVALGGSVATPREGLEGELVEASSFEELKALGPRVAGRIVLLNRPMMRNGESFGGYGDVAPLRRFGAVEAARLGARAVLIRSLGTGAYRLPHTGAMQYQEGVAKIPFAALAAEDAELLHRALAQGVAQVRLRLTCHLDGEVDSANVIGEVKGRERPDEIVLLGAHLDSWDLGTGAIDDGAGCGMVIAAARLIAQLGAPRRTVRVALFMNEERGLSGARAYAADHRAELVRHVAALEADSGAGRPLGFAVVGGAASVALLSRWAAPLSGLRASAVQTTEEAGADLIPLHEAGVPAFMLRQDLSSYFDWHHTAADTLDKIDPFELHLATAAIAVVARAAAESVDLLPRISAGHQQQ